MPSHMLYGRTVTIGRGCSFNSIQQPKIEESHVCIFNSICINRYNCSIYETAELYYPWCDGTTCTQKYMVNATTTHADTFICDNKNQTITLPNIRCSYNCTCKERNPTKTSSSLLMPTSETDQHSSSKIRYVQMSLSLSLIMALLFNVVFVSGI